MFRFRHLIVFLLPAVFLKQIGMRGRPWLAHARKTTANFLQVAANC
jgi:hypothetical protein